MSRTEQIQYIDSPDDIKWDIEVDLLVIGAGGCGLVAALAAAEQGASVLVVEKEKAAGGNTSLSQAMVPAVGTSMQQAAGIEDSVELMTADILKKNRNGSNPELTAYIAKQSASLIEWLKDSMGIQLELVTDFLYPGHSALRIHANRSRKGENLINNLLDAAARFENLDSAYNAPASKLIAGNLDSAVLGAEIEIEGIGTNLARAGKTILALNGFGANREMIKKYIPEMASAYYFGHEGNTGEGILWGRDLGAELLYMGAYQSHGSVAHPHGTLLTWAIISLGGYQVNLDGERFVNEFHGYSEHALDVLEQKDGVAIEIYDEKIYQQVKDYEDIKQCYRMGAIRKFDSIESLAEGFNLPVHTLQETHRLYQLAAAGKQADPLGRMEFERPLELPLYATKVTGALFHTQGGLKTDEYARVIKKDNHPIPNLYAGGGTAAGFSGRSGPSGYLSANGLMAALILGKLAGEHAAEAVK